MLTRLAALLVLAIATVSVAEDAAAVAIPDREGRDALYAWLDTVGYPDGVEGDIILLPSYQDTYEIAFVVEENAESIRVFSETGIRSTRPHEQEWEYGEFEKACRERLHRLEREIDPRDGPFGGNPWQLAERARLVLFARSAARRGLAELEQALLAKAATRGGVLEWRHDREGKALAELVRGDVQIFERVQAFTPVYGELDSATRRAKLLRFVDLFPDSDAAEAAQKDADVLARMIEDEHEVPSAEQAAALSGEERARALVARLRYQHAWGGVNGSPILHMNGDGDTPLDRLISMGDVAIPVLIEALDDDTLTFATSDGRVGMDVSSVPVGHAARDGLYAITGEWFPDADAAREWLARKASGGEFDVVRARAIQDTWVDERAAQRLIAIDAPAAFAAFAEAFARTEAIEMRVTLASMIGRVETEEAADWLRAETATDRPFPIRQIAAQRLHDRGGAEGRDVLVALWNEVSGPKPLTYPAAAAAVQMNQNEQYGWERLCPWMVENGEWDAIAAGLADKTPWVRALVLRSMAQNAPGVLDGLDLVPAEQLLEAALTDSTDIPDGVWSSGLGNTPDGRLADLVAGELAFRFADRFTFSGQAPREVRDAEIARMRNALRARIGEPLIPEPALPAIDSVAMAEVLHLVGAIVDDDLAARDAAENAIVHAGLPALAPLSRAYATQSRDTVGRKAFERGIRRLACTVREIIVRDGASATAAAGLGELVGKPLDPDALVTAVRTASEAGEPITLLLHRSGDGTGVVVVLDRLDPTAEYQYDLEGSYSRWGARRVNEETWTDFKSEVRRHIATRPDQSWALRMRLRP